MAQKYYWLKLKRDFFKRHDIRVIEDMPNGKDYILFYLKLLVESIDHEGNLRFNETIPYSAEMLSSVTNTNVDIIKGAINLFKNLEMIEILDDETIFLNEVNNLIGCETSAAERMRKSRETANLLEKCNNVQECYKNVTQSKSKSKSKIKNIDIKENIKEKKVHGEFQNVLLTNIEYEKLQNKFSDYEDKIFSLSSYLENNKKKHYDSHYATILNWDRRANKDKPKEFDKL
jgi:predicted phage replisome organizer